MEDKDVETSNKNMKELALKVSNNPELLIQLVYVVKRMFFEAGIMKVVAFLDKPCTHKLRAIDCPQCWEAQLKKWKISLKKEETDGSIEL